VGNNGEGIAGVCWRVKLMALKVQATGVEVMDSWAVIQAVYYAMDHGARIVNCSFGGEAYEQIEYDAFQDLKEAGILAVCAAGNEIHDTDDLPNYPSSHDLDNILSVAASDPQDRLATFSNYGQTSVDIMAPGVNVQSTLPAGQYTEASVTVDALAGTTEYIAIGMEFADTTDEDGITATLYACGKGYPDEFPPEVSGNIALIERGNRDGKDFYFSEKTVNAQDAGAVAVIIYNDILDEFDQNGGTLGAPGNWVPVVSLPKADGEALKALGTPTVTLVNYVTEDNTPIFGLSDGTSMAAPFVAGTAGLIFSQNPGLDYVAVKSAILDSADKIPAVAEMMVSGGRVNAFCALCSLSTVPGDLSCNGDLGIDDAILALQVAAGLNPGLCTALVPTRLDLNGDSRIGLEEAICVLQETAGFGR
jgi:subtilisin family serine protease